MADSLRSLHQNDCTTHGAEQCSCDSERDAAIREGRRWIAYHGGSASRFERLIAMATGDSNHAAKLRRRLQRARRAIERRTCAFPV
jgi:hypothetical protein